VPKPWRVVFADFEVRCSYKKRVEVTNASLSFNDFRLLPLEDSVRDFFEIDFAPPGRMSAGTSHTFTVTFKPKVNSDIFTEIRLRASTGHESFPLIALTKKTVLKFNPPPAIEERKQGEGKGLLPCPDPLDPEDQPDAPPFRIEVATVNVGNVLETETGRATLTVWNEGALPTKFVLSRRCVRGDLRDATEEEREQGTEAEANHVGSLTCSHMSGEFAAHSKRVITFTFQARRVGKIEHLFDLVFSNNLVLRKEVVVRAETVDVPVFCELPRYDFRVLASGDGHTYRQQLVLHNRRGTAKRVVVNQPRKIEGELVLSPSLGYIQGYGTLVINAEFAPRKGFLDRHPEYADVEATKSLILLSERQLGPTVGACFRIPVSLTASEQQMPVETELFGTLTPDDIEVTPGRIDFGKAFLGDAIGQEIKLRNPSLLPCTFGFVRLPPEISGVCLPTDLLREDPNAVLDATTHHKRFLAYLDALAAAEEEAAAAGTLSEMAARAKGEGEGGAAVEAVTELPADPLSKVVPYPPPEDALDTKTLRGAVLDGGGEGLFGIIRPGETRRIVLTFAPLSAVLFKKMLSLRVIVGDLCAREVLLPSRGEGIDAPVAVRPGQTVKMAVIAVDQRVRESVVVANTKKKGKIQLCISAPPKNLSRLTATPNKLTLGPGESRRVQLEFAPLKSYAHTVEPVSLPPEPTEQEGEKSEEGGEEQEDVAAKRKRQLEELQKEAEDNAAKKFLERQEEVKAQGGRLWMSNDRGYNSLHAQWKLPIYFRNLKEGEDQEPTEMAGEGDGEGGPSAATTEFVLMDVHTTLGVAVITADPPKVDFGDVSVGESKLMHVAIRNHFPFPLEEEGEDPEKDCRQHLFWNDPPEVSGFEVVNCPRAVGERPFVLVLRFRPAAAQLFASDLEIFSHSTRLRLPLRGRGVTPILSLDPPDGVLDLGALAAAPNGIFLEKVSKTIHVINESEFALFFKIHRPHPPPPMAPTQDPRGVPPFTCVPDSGLVPPRGKLPVSVTFRPTKLGGQGEGDTSQETGAAGGRVREKFLVWAANQPKPSYLFVHGRCCERQMFVAYDTPAKKFGEECVMDASKGDRRYADEHPTASTGEDPEAVAAAATAAAGSGSFSLVFDGAKTGALGDSLTEERKIVVGCAWPVGTNGNPQEGQAGGNFEFQIPQTDAGKHFSVDPPKGTLKAGETLTATFKLNHQDPEGYLTALNVRLQALQAIGQWVTVDAKCVLSGGFVASGASPTQTVSIQLKAYQPHI